MKITKSFQLTAKQKLGLEDLPVMFLALAGVLFLWSAFKIIYLKFPANQIISNPTSDRPYIRPEAFEEPRNVGFHFFGDFLQTFDWATLANPWTSNSEFLVQYPSVPVYLLKLLTPFPYFTAMWIYLTLMVVSSAAAVWLVLPSFRLASRLSAALGIGVMSAPALMAFDRGNSVGFLAILFAIFIYGVVRENKKLAVLSLILMATTKIYPLLLLAVFVRLKWWRELVATVLLGAGATILLFLITPGNFLETIEAWMAANTGASSLWDETLVLGAQALLGYFGVFDASFVDLAATAIVNFWGIVRYVFMGLALLLIIFRPQNSKLEMLALGGFSMMLFYTAPHNYAWTWALPLVAAFINHLKEIESKHGELKWGKVWSDSPTFLITLFGLLAIILPLPVAVPGTQKSILPFLGYILILGVVTISTLSWLKILRTTKFQRA